MADFTTSPPTAIPLSVSSFLRMFGSGGVDVTSLFVGVSQASHTFTTTFPGVLVPTQTTPHASLVADIGADLGVPWAQWANKGTIPDGTVIVIKADPSFVDSPIGSLADFISSSGSIPIPGSVFSTSEAQSIGLPTTSFTPNPPSGGFAYAVVPGSILTSEGSMITDENRSIITAN